jgi:predicted phosphodiesterase
MKLAVISDIHANYYALREVLGHIESLVVDGIICLGDVVGYGPAPAECLQLLRDYSVQTVMGNHDAVLCGLERTTYYNEYARQALAIHEELLEQHDKAFIQSFAKQIQLEDCLFIHGALTQPFEYITNGKDMLINQVVLEQTYPDVRIVFFGHTHVRLIGRQGETLIPEDGIAYDIQLLPARYFINPGSVGQPRGGIDNRASFLIYDQGTDQVQFYYVPYDIGKTHADIIRKKIPEYLGKRLHMGI